MMLALVYLFFRRLLGVIYIVRFHCRVVIIQRFRQVVVVSANVRPRQQQTVVVFDSERKNLFCSCLGLENGLIVREEGMKYTLSINNKTRATTNVISPAAADAFVCTLSTSILVALPFQLSDL